MKKWILIIYTIYILASFKALALWSLRDQTETVFTPWQFYTHLLLISAGYLTLVS